MIDRSMRYVYFGNDRNAAMDFVDTYWNRVKDFGYHSPHVECEMQVGTSDLSAIEFPKIDYYGWYVRFDVFGVDCSIKELSTSNPVRKRRSKS